jgi:hypothetical protein
MEVRGDRGVVDVVQRSPASNVQKEAVAVEPTIQLLTKAPLAGAGDPEVEQDHHGKQVEQENVVAPCDNGLAEKLLEKGPAVQGSEDPDGIFATVGADPVAEGASCDKEDGVCAVSSGDRAGNQFSDIETGAGPMVQTQPSKDGGLTSHFEREDALGELRGPSPLEHGSDMQMILAEKPPAAASMKEAEVVALGRMKAFCAKILKTLAPPLLREVQAASVLRPEAEPYTPRRSGRTSHTPPATPIGKPPRKATAAETVLLKALGITPADLTVDEVALQEFKHFFDSPVREQHIKVLASVFGKTMPTRQEMERQGAVEIRLCA